MTDTMTNMGRDYHSERLHELEEADDTFDAPPVAHDEATAKHRHNPALRASQGNRTDWVGHLEDMPGYSLVPEDVISLSLKRSRNKSIKAAAIKRGKRRDRGGVTLHYNPTAWRGLKKSDQDAFLASKPALALVGHRWDWNADFHWYGEEDASNCLHQLFRFGTATPRAPQTFSRYLWEGTAKRRNWYAEELDDEAPGE